MGTIDPGPLPDNLSEKEVLDLMANSGNKEAIYREIRKDVFDGTTSNSNEDISSPKGRLRMNFIRLDQDELPEPEGRQLENRALVTREEILRSNSLRVLLNELELEHGTKVIRCTILGGDGLAQEDILDKPV